MGFSWKSKADTSEWVSFFSIKKQDNYLYIGKHNTYE